MSHPEKKTNGPRRYEPVSDTLILVALDRAERHEAPNQWDAPGVLWHKLLDHLGFARNSWTTRNLRPQVQSLVDAGLVSKTKVTFEHVLWSLTEAGAVLVSQARLQGEDDLPTSPQRQQWKNARAEAAALLETTRKALTSELQAARRLLDTNDADPGKWAEMADRLSLEAHRLGAALFCLHDWAEPDDEHPGAPGEWRQNPRVRDALNRLRTKPPDMCANSETLATIMLPLSVIPRVREGAFAELDDTGEALETSVRERAMFATAYGRVSAAWALLDVIGWHDTDDTGTGVELTVSDHGPMLLASIERIVPHMRDWLDEMDPADPAKPDRTDELRLIEQFQIQARRAMAGRR